MSIDNIKKRLSENSKQDNSWLDKAKWRKENEAWLDMSFAISVKILSTFRANKKTGTFPKSQKELAEAMDCTPQYINKLLKGTENLTIETISKLEGSLDTKLIEVSEILNEEESLGLPFVTADFINTSYMNSYSYTDFIIETANTPLIVSEIQSVYTKVEEENKMDTYKNNNRSHLKLVA